ncbi:TATA element modulatory factor 1 [Chytriomyces hyalinus]|nr:TATA element modulatory factor 1 [Chytriomyces hyalinus]
MSDWFSSISSTLANAASAVEAQLDKALDVPGGGSQKRETWTDAAETKTPNATIDFFSASIASVSASVESINLKSLSSDFAALINSEIGAANPPAKEQAKASPDRVPLASPNVSAKEQITQEPKNGGTNSALQTNVKSIADPSVDETVANPTSAPVVDPTSSPVVETPPRNLNASVQDLDPIEIHEEALHENAPVISSALETSETPASILMDTPPHTILTAAAESFEPPTNASNTSDTPQDSLKNPVTQLIAPPASNTEAFASEPLVTTVPEISKPIRSETDKLSSIISQREQQLLAAITENAALTDEIAKIRTRIQDLETYRGAQNEAGDAAAMDEFSKRLESAEKAGSAALKDRDKYKQKLGLLQSSFDEAIKKLGEREEQVKSLLEEGEKLSKNELKMSNIVKKLRAKEADAEKEMKEQQKKFDALSAELTELKEKFARVTETDRKLGENLKSSNELADKQAKQIVKLENETATIRAELTQHKALLERARADLADSKALVENANSVAHAEALEKEISANEALHKQLLEQQKNHSSIESALQKEVFDLRSLLARVEDEANWKEDNMRKEVMSLQNRLQATEARHEDLFAEARAADRPLVRQIESLQVQHAAARKDWEQIEIRFLLLEDAPAEKERLEFAERERVSVERYEDLNKRFVAIEYQFSRERQERSRIQAELEESMSKLDGSVGTINDLSAKINVIKSGHERDLQQMRVDFEERIRQAVDEETRKLKETMRQERERFHAEKQKLQDLKIMTEKTYQQQQQHQQQHQQPASAQYGASFSNNTAAGSPSTAASMMSPSGSMASIRMSMSGDGLQSPSSMMGSLELNSGMGAASVHQGAVVERLVHNLKQLQGQVSSLQMQMQLVTKTRDELAEELVKATAENSDLKNAGSKIESLETQLTELTRRYNAALEMLGEKTEQVDELQERILEMKRIQKAEIEEIMRLRGGA